MALQLESNLLTTEKIKSFVQDTQITDLNNLNNLKNKLKEKHILEPQTNE